MRFLVALFLTFAALAVPAAAQTCQPVHKDAFVASGQEAIKSGQVDAIELTADQIVSFGEAIGIGNHAGLKLAAVFVVVKNNDVAQMVVVIENTDAGTAVACSGEPNDTARYALRKLLKIGPSA